MYHIDLTTILRVFAHQDGRLDTELRHMPGVRERCHAQLFLVNGKVVSCIIEGKSGVLFSGGDALHMLQSMGVLEWTYTAEVQDAPPPIPTQLSPTQPRLERVAENKAMIFPIRIRFIEPQEFAQWSRWQRSVYNMTDGSKSIVDIARVLAQPEERIMETLSELQRQRAIAFERSPRSR